MNNSTYPNKAQEAIFVPVRARITWPLTLTLSTPWTQTYLETIVFKFGRDPVICLREEAMYSVHVHYVCTLCTSWRTDYNTSLPLAGEVIMNYIGMLNC